MILASVPRLSFLKNSISPIRFLSAFVLLASLCSLSAVQAQAGYAHILIDMGTGEVLAEQNADQVNHPASLTKMMTLYLTFEALKNGELTWDSRIKISERGAQTPAYKFALPVGTTFSVREAVEGMIVISANDAAESMCDHFGARNGLSCGAVMTAKARALGMDGTRFINGSGLHDDAQVTTARDMVTLAKALIRDFPDEYKLFSKKSFSFRSMKLRGHNSLMYRYDGMDGLKTGFTDPSGYNLASSAVRGGRRLVGVVLGAKSGADRANKMEAMMNSAFGGAAADAPVMALASIRPSIAPRQLTGAKEAAAILAVAPKPSPGKENSHTASAAGRTATVRSDWEVQVAAVERQEAAIAVLNDARTALGNRFAEVFPVTQTISRDNMTLIRARLTGFNSKAAANEACQLLKAQSKSCFVVNSKA
ncbi:serine hydrolase [Roseibium sp.]|uniref:serine hydrolase n=1 Tax=Roseibium sp. TaxID=1936156 RepID=UPI003A978093